MSLARHRGHAAELQRVFDTSRIPMLLTDSERRHISSNPAARLFFRRTSAQLRGHHIQDFTPRSHLTEQDASWRELMKNGVVAGTSVLKTPDGATISIDYYAVANLLPGRHVTIWLPADWRPEELGPVLDEEPAPPEPGQLTEREREVLATLGSGATLREISDQLALSPHTVKTHLRNAVKRLGARHRAHAIAIALRDGQI
jgi:DNA-binding CsgD family transcriptional regulator